MNTKKGWIVVTLVGVVIVVGAILILRTPSADNLPPAGETPEGNGVTRAGVTHQVVMKDNEFLPAEITISAGDTVNFVNEDEGAHWPASGVHPTHLLCPGFDALKGLEKGEAYSFTFKQSGTCPTHDHLMPSMLGKIIIE